MSFQGLNEYKGPAGTKIFMPKPCRHFRVTCNLRGPFSSHIMLSHVGFWGATSLVPTHHLQRFYIDRWAILLLSQVSLIWNLRILFSYCNDRTPGLSLQNLTWVVSSSHLRFFNHFENLTPTMSMLWLCCLASRLLVNMSFWIFEALTKCRWRSC